MDLAKYRNLFLEEATEHLAEMSRALLELEKDPAQGEAIDLVFRMAHSIKGMAGSLDYAAITELAHALEDRMDGYRSVGRVDAAGGLPVLFRGLEGLERMVEAVRTTGQPSAPDSELLELLRGAPPGAAAESRPKKRAGAAVETAGKRPVAVPAPPPSVRVRTEVLDRFLNAVGEVVLTSKQVRTAAEDDRGGSATEVSVGFDRMERAVGELQRRALSLRTAPLLRAVDALPRLAREVARQTGKSVEVELSGAELELDRSILDRLGDPLVHLVRNAVDHGIEAPERRREAGKPEAGKLTVDARRDKNTIRISVIDDGAGIDLDRVRAKAVEQGLLHPDLAGDLPPEEIASLVFAPGLSTRSEVSDISGRGVGMDAVRSTIEALGGHVELRSQPGRGTTTTLVVPITAAVQRVLLVGMGWELVAIPIAKVERIVEVAAASIERAGREAFTLVDGEPLLVIDLGERLELAPPPPTLHATLILAELRGQRVGVRVERLAGQQEIYVKPVPELLASARALAGMTVLGDGRPVFVLDLNQIAW